MQHNIFFLFLLSIIFCNPYNIIKVKALIGQNVRTAEENEFTAIAALAFINDQNTVEKNIFCTGTLITRSHILTSEHCFDRSTNDPYVIIADSYDLNRGKIYFPSWWLSYDQWCITRRIRITENENDLALVKIFFHVAAHVIPMRRSEISRNRYYFGHRATIAGWGQINNDTLPTILHTVNVTIISNIECTDIILRLQRQRIPVPGKFLCSKAIPYAFTTPGDSGNPLIIDGILVAVTKGLIPILGGRFHPEKANIHLSIQRYNRYIESLTLE